MHDKPKECLYRIFPCHAMKNNFEAVQRKKRENEMLQETFFYRLNYFENDKGELFLTTHLCRGYHPSVIHCENSEIQIGVFSK